MALVLPPFASPHEPLLQPIGGALDRDTADVGDDHVRLTPVGVGKEMLRDLIERDACDGATHFQITIAENKRASSGLVGSFARVTGGERTDGRHFECAVHFDGQHDSEQLVTITLPEPGALVRAAQTGCSSSNTLL